jgi:hypothetical protein
MTGRYDCPYLGSLGRRSRVIVVPPRHPSKCCALSLGNAPLKLSCFLAHTSDWEFLSILESGRHKLLNAHDLMLGNPSLCGWEVLRLGPSPTLGSLGPSQLWCHKSRVSLWDSPSAHGVAGIHHREMHHNCCLHDVHLVRNKSEVWTWKT